jgi:hypothetical protein
MVSLATVPEWSEASHSSASATGGAVGAGMAGADRRLSDEGPRGYDAPAEGGGSTVIGLPQHSFHAPAQSAASAVDCSASSGVTSGSPELQAGGAAAGSASRSRLRDRDRGRDGQGHGRGHGSGKHAVAALRPVPGLSRDDPTAGIIAQAARDPEYEAMLLYHLRTQIDEYVAAVLRRRRAGNSNAVSGASSAAQAPLPAAAPGPS